MITGDEVFYGRIQDKFEPIIRKKVAETGGEVIDLAFLPDHDEQIAAAAIKMVDQGANLIISTGGMSVDPDDRSRYAFKKGRSC
jgi:molybdopterin-biosynthesis enzyme MoeA-like protein